MRYRLYGGECEDDIGGGSPLFGGSKIDMTMRGYDYTNGSQPWHPFTFTTRWDKLGGVGEPNGIFQGNVDYDIMNPLKSSVTGSINIGDYSVNLTLGLDEIGFSGSYTNNGVTTTQSLFVNIIEVRVGYENSVTTIKSDGTGDKLTERAEINVGGFLLVGSAAAGVGTLIPAIATVAAALAETAVKVGVNG